MNYERFIELLNLYIDHEIAPEDAKALEHEIRHSPERRQVYEQYCRIHKATADLFESSLRDAPTPALRRSYQEISRKVRAHQQEPSVSWLTWGATGALAAAACVALVFVAQPNAKRSPSAPAIANHPAPVEPAATIAVSAPAEWSSLSYHSFSADLTGNTTGQAIKLRPITKVQTNVPKSFGDGVVMPTPAPSELTLKPAVTSGTTEEMSAVQFKK